MQTLRPMIANVLLRACEADHTQRTKFERMRQADHQSHLVPGRNALLGPMRFFRRGCLTAIRGKNAWAAFPPWPATASRPDRLIDEPDFVSDRERAKASVRRRRRRRDANAPLKRWPASRGRSTPVIGPALRPRWLPGRAMKSHSGLFRTRANVGYGPIRCLGPDG